MATTGFKLPTTIIKNGVGVNKWNNSENILLADELYTSPGSGVSSLTVGTFGFNIPQSSSIQNITLRIKGYQGSGNDSVSFYAVDDLTGTVAEYPFEGNPFTGFTGTNQVHNLVPTSFGTTWTVDQINNFKIKMVSSGNIYVDTIEAMVEYTPVSIPGTGDDICEGELVVDEFVQGIKFDLAESFREGDTSFLLRGMNYPDGVTQILISDFHGDALMTLSQGVEGREENIRITNIEHNYNGTGLTRVSVGSFQNRGLAFKYPYKSDPSLVRSHPSSAEAVISNSAPFYDRFVKKNQKGVLFSSPIKAYYNDDKISSHISGVNIIGNGVTASIEQVGDDDCDETLRIEVPTIEIQDDGVSMPFERVLNFRDFFIVTNDSPSNRNTVDINTQELTNDEDFIDYLIANTYFTTRLASDQNFYTVLGDNEEFIDVLINNEYFSYQLANSNEFIDNLIDNTYFTINLATDETFITNLTNDEFFQTTINNFIEPQDTVANFGKIAQYPQLPDSNYYKIIGDVDGVNKVFSVETGKFIPGKVKVELNGVTLTEGTGGGWSIVDPNTGTFQLHDAPITSDVLIVHYNDIAGDISQGVAMVVGNLVDNTDADYPEVNLHWDNTTITGDGSSGDPLKVTNPHVKADWDASSGPSEILNKPNIPNVTGKADKVTKIDASTGLVGGGDLSQDRTISLSPGTINSLSKADSAVQPSDLLNLTTDDVSEGLNNLYFTDERVLETELDGFSASSGTVSSADDVLSAIEKLQGQINSASAGLNYLGAWDAGTNTPTITSGVGSLGDYYVVSVSGSTNIDGISAWVHSDWIIFNGNEWQQISNSSDVNSVNGKTGVVVLTKGDIGLANVDNTSDTDKPISTATQNALDLKANAIDVSGKADKVTRVDAGTGLVGGGDLSTDRTISLSSGTITSLGKADTALQTETDPTVPNHVKNITSGDINNWNSKIGLGSLATVATSGSYNDLIDKPTIPNITGKADKITKVDAGTGLVGGGDLSTDRTISLSASTISSLSKADSALQTETDPTVPGHVKSITAQDIINWDNKVDPVDISNKAERNTRIDAGTGLVGGGDISQDRTISLSAATQNSLGKADTALQTETDPTVPAHVKNITSGDINNWDSKGDVNTTGAQTIEDKRIKPRAYQTSNTSSITPNLSNYSFYSVTNLTNGSITINAPTGSPVLGEVIVIHIATSSSSKTLTMNNTYKPFGAVFPSSIKAGEPILITAQFNGSNWMTLWSTQK